MSAAALLRERLAAGPPLLLDGATGAALHARGIPTPPPLWSASAMLDAPGVLRDIAREFVEAGAELVTTNTFRTHERNLARGGLGGRQAELNALAVRLAREGVAAAGRPALVAGSITTLEDCYRPDLVPDDGACLLEHTAQAQSLAAGGADCLLVETLNTVRESVAATRAATATGLPVISCVVCGPGGRLLSGEPVEEWAAAVAPLGPVAMGINCTRLETMGQALAALAQAQPAMPRVAYGNIGTELPSGLWDSTDCPPERYAAAAATWLDLGVRIVGGCCGTGPAHIAALTALIE